MRDYLAHLVNLNITDGFKKKLYKSTNKSI